MAKHIVLLAVVVFASVVSATTTIYENGPQSRNPDLGAFSFNGANFVTNTFTVSGGTSTISGIMIWTWMWPTDHNLSAELTITSEPNGGTVYFDQMIQFSQSNCWADGLGFNHCQQSANWNNGAALNNGTYWLTLKNGSFPSGNEVFWDSNNGVACQSQGCPSQARYRLGTIPSESFTVTGTSGGDRPTRTPKTTSLLLFSAGFVGLVGITRRRLG